MTELLRSCGCGWFRSRCEVSNHNYKYALAYVVGGECVLRYDNEAGKGDHKHVGALELRYLFETPQKLLSDFWFDVDHWRP